MLETLGSFTGAHLPFREAEYGPFDARGTSDTDRQRLIELLSPSPIDLDDLVRESMLPAAIATCLLLELELAGKIIRHAQGAISLSA
ncbi:hypothetical protein [Aestuariivirga sp.]|uniref:DprA-like winged helix domain-containing protein n=1 Tax=Aestuariivirga sp. TaxID=2650926 RepID=UPI0039E575B1